MTHTIEQPGLHAHSWNPETDLLKQYRVEKRIEGGGWLALASFDEYGDAYDNIVDRSGGYGYDPDIGWTFEGKFDGTYRVYDQFQNGSWVFNMDVFTLDTVSEEK